MFRQYSSQSMISELGTGVGKRVVVGLAEFGTWEGADGGVVGIAVGEEIGSDGAQNAQAVSLMP